MSDPSAFPPPPPSGGFAPPPPPSGGFAPPPAPTAAGFGAPGMPGGAPALQLTSRGKRFGAYLLEGLLVIVTLFIGWLIWSVIAWGKGQTPAKQVLGMRVVKLDERRPATMGEMALRELVGKFLLAMVPFYTLVGAIFVLTDDNNQGLWDKIAGTTVVEDPNNAFGL
jgi:uncharacterized RDD family membrane protein YckC